MDAMKTVISILNTISLVLVILTFLILFCCLAQFLYHKYGGGQVSAEEQQQWQQHTDNQAVTLGYHFYSSNFIQDQTWGTN